MLFDNFQNSVLKLHEETGKNDANKPVQVGASKGPNERSNKFIFLVCFQYMCTHFLSLAALHMAAALCAPLAKICKTKTISFNAF